jgi:hypothetical protein
MSRILGAMRLIHAFLGCCIGVAVALAACGDNIEPPTDAAIPVTIGGTVSGLAGSGLVLQNNGGDDLTITADGTFTFAMRAKPGSPYAITVATQPSSPAQMCTVANGTGIATPTGVADVTVTCTTSTFTVGGMVTGLTGSGLVIENNGTDDLTISADGTFTFATPLKSGTAFAVTVATQPAGPTQTCTVSGGTGTIGNGNVTTVVVDCAVDRFTVGGIVSGLAGPVVLQNNGGDDITVTANGSFAFPTTVASGATYAVTVAAQPTTPSQTCIVTSGSGTVTNADVTSVRVDCTTNTFTIGGTVTGLAGNGLVLQNNGGETLAIASDGTFTFPTQIASGASYAVTVMAQPSLPTQVCTVAMGSGTVGGAAVTNIAVTCSTSAFSIGGTVTGLAGSGLVLQNNGGDNLAVSADGTFTFTTPVASGAAFNVTVFAQPTGPSQTCTVSGGTGTVGAGPVTSVAINCTTDRFTVGGTISGLAGTVVLQNNSGDNLTLTANGSFAFSTPVASGNAYAVTVFTQPTGPTQVCTVTNGSGTVTAANVTNVQIVCVTQRFTIGGTVTGLAGTGLVLRDNGGDDLPISSDGTFTFSTSIDSGSAYAVTVASQPTNLSQTCTVTNASGIVGGANVTNVQVACTTNTYSIGGTVTGLAGTGLVLRDNGGDDLSITTNGTFAFTTKIASGGSYAVTVLAQPNGPTQSCTVAGGSGNVTSSDITSVVITCTTLKFHIGGTVTGLAGSGLVLQNNGGDDLSISADGTFTFATPIDSGASFAVTVKTQPTGPSQTCSVTGGTGTVGGGDVTGVMVNCTTNRYAIGGTVTGLNGTLVLQNNGGDDLTLTANGTFAFSTTIASGATYSVTVLTNPTNPIKQTCVVTNGSGTVGSASVTSVAVACTTDRFTIRGTLSGLASSESVVLRNNGADDLTVSANGAFAFSTTVLSGGAYAVTVLTNPASPIAQTCIVTNDSGIVGSTDVTNVSVACTANQYTIRATVTGLSGSPVVLQNNGGNDLSVSSDGTSAFTTQVASGGTYAVTVKTQPNNRVCKVSSGSGTVGSANVTVSVTCSPVCFSFTNTSGEDLTGNNWFDACATTTGNTLTFTLRDTNGNVVYQQSGAKVGVWSPYNFLTSTNMNSWGTPPNDYNDQFYSPNHDRMIVLGNGDRVMIPGRWARNQGCGGSLGDGYGIVIYPSAPNYYNNIKLMVQPYRQTNYALGQPRSFSSWSTSHEISYNGGVTMNSCFGSPSLTAFLGSFEITVSP